MTAGNRNTLCKQERLHGRSHVEELFKKAGSRSMAIFPLRVVYALCDAEESFSGQMPRDRVSMLVSVPKRHFKRAVKRNRVKRQVREAYRTGKHSLCECVGSIPGKRLSVAFVWLADELYPTAEVADKVVRLLSRIEENIRSRYTQHPQTDTQPEQ